MTAGELRTFLDKCDANAKVKICAKEPAGWICPDGATVDVETVCHGIDWHNGEILIVPRHSLNIVDVDSWSNDRRK